MLRSSSTKQGESFIKSVFMLLLSLMVQRAPALHPACQGGQRPVMCVPCVLYTRQSPE
jgi:hypothetical protein